MRKLPTGELCAGEPHAQFGGRGGRESFPTPIFGWEPRFPVFPESRRWIDGGSAKVSYAGPIPKGSPQPQPVTA